MSEVNTVLYTSASVGVAALYTRALDISSATFIILVKLVIHSQVFSTYIV